MNKPKLLMQFKFQSMLTLILWICQWLHEASEIYNDMWIYMMWMYIYMIIYMHMLSHVGLFTSHAVTSFQWMIFVLRSVLHVRGGWVGTCSFPMQWWRFDPAQLILRFPPQNGEKKQQSCRLKNMKRQCNACNSKCHMQWPMQCYAASPFEIELPFDRSRRK